MDTGVAFYDLRFNADDLRWAVPLLPVLAHRQAPAFVVDQIGATEAHAALERYSNFHCSMKRRISVSRSGGSIIGKYLDSHQPTISFNLSRLVRSRGSETVAFSHFFNWPTET